MNYIELSEAVVAAARPCFNDVDTNFVETELDSGEYFLAVLDALTATARETHPLPSDLLAGLRGWVAGAEGGVPDLYRAKFVELLDQTPTATSADVERIVVDHLRAAGMNASTRLPGVRKPKRSA